MLLREPPVLAWLLALRAPRSHGEEARLASGAIALLDCLNPADEQRQRSVLYTLCTIELHLLEASAGVLTPDADR